MQNNNTNNQNKKSINDKELEVLKFWTDYNIFEKSIANPAGRVDGEIESFSFYDGPPFATGTPHHGHILASTIKDAIPRYHTMNGKSVRRIWGWDCHGLPIENMIEKELNLNSKKEIEEYGIDKFNKAAADSVLRYEEIWKKQIPRLGRWVDMEHSYKTMDSTYTESVWWVWKTLYDKGLAYEGHKIMHICPRCETPLAQSEVGLEYTDVTDLSVTTRFELVDEPRTFVLAWTTTPWTLPGNTALAVNKDIEYVKFKINEIALDDKDLPSLIKNCVVGELYIACTKYFQNETGLNISDGEAKMSGTGYFSLSGLLTEKKTIINLSYERFFGDKLVGKKYKPPFRYFYDKDDADKELGWKIWHADFITEDAGTGIAHEAPAFGAEDMELAKANSIPVIKHVKMDGTFTTDVTDFAGMKVKVKDDTMSADIEIIRWLAKNHLIFEKHKIVHSYPLCWRCKTPLLNYATSSWFVDVPKIKDKLISENQKVGWIPEHIRDGRMGRWLEGAREWAVSRRRYWGAPLPIWRSVDGVETLVVGSLAEIAQPPRNKYFVMRHGEAISNIKNVLDCSGDPKNHLTEQGINQVTEFTKNAKKFDYIFTSPFIRTKQTAEIVCEATGFDKSKIIYDDRLKEINSGTYDGVSIDKYFKEINEQISYDSNSKIGGGESHREVMNRAMAFLLEIDKKYENKSILIVSHGDPIFMMSAAAQLLVDGEVFSKEREYPKHGEIKSLDYKVIPRDETGAVNLHKPYIDQVILKDSRGVDMKIIGDVFDCWFESGSMPYAQLHYPFENKEVFEKNFPANFIAEGMDQTRGWFYSLLNLGVGLFDKSPFKNVIVNGTVMAEDGRKMSKSEKNYTDPMELVEKYGADALRLTFANSPVMQGENILFTDSMVEEIYKKNIMKIENVLEFYLQNTDLAQGEDTTQNSNILDLWILAILKNLKQKVTYGYKSYKLDEAVRPIENFIDDLSVWYLRRSRDRMKGVNGEADKLQSLATMRYVLIELAKLMAPMSPFIAERIYQSVMMTNKDKRESIHLESWPKVENINKEDKDLIEQMMMTRNICSQLLMLRQKINIPVRQPLASASINKNLDKNLLEIIKEEVNVKEIKIDMTITESKLDTIITAELRREGDQRELSRAIKDMRRDLGLVSSDSISLTIDADRVGLVDGEYQRVMKIVKVVIGEKLSIDKVYTLV